MSRKYEHVTDIRLRPTNAQAQQLLRLSSAHETVTRLCLNQAALQREGTSVALSALAGGTDHPDRSPVGEAAALRGLLLFNCVPHGVIVYAIENYQMALAVHRQTRIKALPAPAGLHMVGGLGLVTEFQPTSAVIVGLGPVSMDAVSIPDWARRPLLGQDKGRAAPATAYGGQAYIDHVWLDNALYWTMDLAFSKPLTARRRSEKLPCARC